jgi:hypothetical protein
VIDLTMPVDMRKLKRAEYYRTLKPIVERRYSADQARLLFIRNRQYGPWDESEQLPESLLTEVGIDEVPGH